MQLSLFKKTYLAYPCSGFDRAEPIFRALNARLRPVETVEEARKTKCEGVLLLGGPDINPFWYGEDNLYSQPAHRDRDTVEWTLARRGLTDNKPIMGICRGMQMLAVASGGALWQDMTRQKVAKAHPAWHNVKVSRPLERYMASLYVNSRHHQALRTVPYGFKVLATSEKDGIIEAIWRPGALGVQWHPEDLFYQDHKWHGLFGWFVSEGLK